MRVFLYIIKRIAISVPLMLIATFVVFAMLRLSGIDPVNVMQGESTISPEVREALIQQFGLDKPLLTQYGYWLMNLLQGDFGLDYVGRQSVNAMIVARLPVTLGLVVGGLSIGICGGICLGITAAVFRNSWADRVISVITLLLTATPGFLVAIIMLLLLVWLFPQASFIGTFQTPAEYISRLALPSLALGCYSIAMIARITRTQMIEQLNAQHSVAAQARGLRQFSIVTHGFRNAMIPVLTVAAIFVGVAVAGTVLIETVFSLPGLSSLLINGIKSYNYPVVQAVSFILLAIFFVSSIVADILYGVVDPRVRNVIS
ncbi:MAG: ABC transporter permease [Coriobacteriales bacterium]|jgi:peptide/nickel transport system permease protein|nr:ABC transporter permease [Coriobacteriales bacterium]